MTWPQVIDDAFDWLGILGLAWIAYKCWGPKR